MLPVAFRRDPDGGGVRGVARGVREQVVQHLHDALPVGQHGRQVGRQVDPDGVPGAWLLGETLERRKAYFRTLRDAYDFASTVLHAGSLNEKNTEKLANTIDEAQDLYWRSSGSLPGGHTADYESGGYAGLVRRRFRQEVSSWARRCCRECGAGLLKRCLAVPRLQAACSRDFAVVLSQLTYNIAMKIANIAEFKNHLSAYLAGRGEWRGGRGAEAEHAVRARRADPCVGAESNGARMRHGHGCRQVGSERPNDSSR